LTRDAVGQALADLSGLAPGSGLVTDYTLPEELRDEAGNYYVSLVLPDSERRGEPWLSFFTPGGVTALLTSRGFSGDRARAPARRRGSRAVAAH
jgi:O-methyltransferase involved in polyketide biosynthesis